jgi:hypothetical protein
MAKRKRRRGGLAGTVQQHRKQAQYLVPNLRGWVKEFNGVLGKQGASYGRRCHEALGLLVGAARVQARYDQERSWGAAGRGGRTGTAKSIRSMQRKFYHACVVAPK